MFEFWVVGLHPGRAKRRSSWENAICHIEHMVLLVAADFDQLDELVAADRFEYLGKSSGVDLLGVKRLAKHLEARPSDGWIGIDPNRSVSTHTKCRKD